MHSLYSYRKISSNKSWCKWPSLYYKAVLLLFFRPLVSKTLSSSQRSGAPLMGRSLDASQIVTQISHTCEAVIDCLGLNPRIITQVYCKKRFALYPYPLSSNEDLCPTKFNQVFLSSYQTFSKWAKENEIKQMCNHELLKLNETINPSHCRPSFECYFLNPNLRQCCILA